MQFDTVKPAQELESLEHRKLAHRLHVHDLVAALAIRDLKDGRTNAALKRLLLAREKLNNEFGKDL